MNNFDDLNLAVKTLQHRAQIQEAFIAKLVKTLIANQKLSTYEIATVIQSLEADYPYLEEKATHQNTALRYFCKKLFTEVPSLTTLEYKRYYK